MSLRIDQTFAALNAYRNLSVNDTPNDLHPSLDCLRELTVDTCNATATEVAALQAEVATRSSASLRVVFENLSASKPWAH